MKVCTIQEHLDLGSDEMEVHQITISYWSFPLLVHFAAGVEGSLEALVCGEVPAPWWPAVPELFNQLCN